MADLGKALSEIVDVVKHLVGTHVHWNVDLSKDVAVAKIEAAQLALLGDDLEEIVDDVSRGDLEETIKDLKKALADAQALAHPVVEDEK